MRAAGPTILITKWHTSAGTNGGKILVVKCVRPIFVDRIQEENPAKRKPRLKMAATERTLTIKKKVVSAKRLAINERIKRLDDALFFMEKSDCRIIIRLCNGAGSDQAERAIRRVIARHYDWMTSRTDPTSEEKFWQGPPPR